jgi:predicted DNA-binding transcriptional regulator YafY
MTRRIEIIDSILQKSSIKISELTQRVNSQLEEEKQVTSKTIKNDLLAIEDLFGVEICKKNGLISYAQKGASIHNTSLTREERSILEFVYNFMSPIRRTPIFQQFDETVSRIFAGSYLRHFPSAHQSRHIQIGDLTPDNGDKWLHTVYRAIIECKRIKILYQTFGKSPKERTISPYVLKEHRNRWYLAAYDHGTIREEKVYLFKLFRISSIEILEEELYNDPGFNPEAYFKYSIGVVHTYNSPPIYVKLKFTGPVCTLIKESPIHRTMVINEESSNHLIVTIHVYHTIELRNMILSFGDQCKVLSPEILQKEIIQQIDSMQQNYLTGV